MLSVLSSMLPRPRGHLCRKSCVEADVSTIGDGITNGSIHCHDLSGKNETILTLWVFPYSWYKSDIGRERIELTT